MVVPDVLAVDGVAVDLDGVLGCDRDGAGVLPVGVLVGVPLVGVLVGVLLVGALVGVPLVGFTPDMSVSIWLTVLDEGLGTEA